MRLERYNSYCKAARDKRGGFLLLIPAVKRMVAAKSEIGAASRIEAACNRVMRPRSKVERRWWEEGVDWRFGG